MDWVIRELAAEETHQLRRAVSADGRADLASMRHELDATVGAWHLGAVDANGRVLATSSFYPVPCPRRPEAEPAIQLQFMAVDPVLQRMGVGSAVLSEAIRRLKTTNAVFLWANARDTAIPFYERFGFRIMEGSASTPPQTGRPHHLIELDLTKGRIHG